MQSASQAEPLDARDPEQLFRAFVYKLAHLCDYMKRGSTVTSFVILQGVRVLYKFAANQQKAGELETTRQYVESLLTKVDQLVSASSGRLQLRAKIHREVLIFNKPRITLYLKQLQAQVEDCRTICNNTQSEDSKWSFPSVIPAHHQEDLSVMQTQQSPLGWPMSRLPCKSISEIARLPIRLVSCRLKPYKLVM